jgi:hypothetical protein
VSANIGGKITHIYVSLMHNHAKPYAGITECDSCDLRGFFCYTPDGGDYNTCPICGGDDYLNDADTTDWVETDDDNRRHFPFCANCKILFGLGCTHAENGCTSSCYNGHLVGKWLDKTTGEIFIGMPEFDSIEDWTARANDVQVLEWVCPNSPEHKHCINGNYPKSDYPQYYDICELRPNTILAGINTCDIEVLHVERIV